MATYDINVEFGKCTLHMDEDEFHINEEVVAELSTKEIRTGNLYFEEHRTNSLHIPFVVTPYSADIEKLRKRMDEDWKIPSPRIVLFAVAETEDSPPDEYRKLSKKLVKGLVHALNTTEMWLCTDGLDYGLSRDIGKAFEIEIERRKVLEKGIQKGQSAFPEIALIGICPREILTFSSKLGKHKISGNEKEVTETKKEICRRYGYFIIVEDTTDTGKGVSNLIFNFAKDLTKECVKKERRYSENDIKTRESPVMVLLLHGKISQVDLILGHLKRGMPLVVFEGSGGLADILAYAYYQATCRPEVLNIAEYIESVLKPQVQNKMQEFYPSLSENRISYLSGKIFDCIRYFKQKDQEFITILNMNDTEFHPSKLPLLLLRALFKSRTSDAVKTVEQKKKDLHLAMDWNSADVAMDEVFAKDRSIKFPIDEDTFFRALTKPHREDFVSLFLNEGFVLHTFLNSSQLLFLFQNSLNKEFFRSVVWESMLGFGTNVDISRDFLDSKLIILIEELTGIPSILNSYELDWNSGGIFDDRNHQEAERKAVAVLIMWAILSYRVKLVKTLMRHSEQSSYLSVACSIILRKLEMHVTDLNLKKEMEEQSIQFSVNAANVMTLCYESVPCRALDILHEKNRVWSHKALMEMAAFAKNKMFLAHPCCQHVLDDIFMGNIRIKDLPYGDITIPLWIKIILCNFLVFPMYLWVRFENPQQKKSINEEATKKHSSENISASTKETKVNSGSWKARVPGFFYEVYDLWSAPISKFWVFMVSYTLFLILFSLAVIWPACGNVYLDFFSCLWIATIIMDSTYHNYTLSNKYSSMPLAYKTMEISIMIIFLFAYALSRLIWMHTFMSSYNTKVMLCLALLYFYYRLIFVSLSISSELGPMLYRIKRMISVDFMSYIRVTMLVVISNGFVIHATVYPEYPMSVELLRRAFYDAFTSFFLTPADHYGIPNPQCIRLKRHPNGISFYGTDPNECRVGRYYKPDCPNPGFWPYIFGLQYMIILRLILNVLLFALFSNTAKKLEEQGKYIWKYQRYELIINFSNRITLPPPLCIITFIYMFLKFVFRQMSYFVKIYIFRHHIENDPVHEDGSEKLDENDFRYWKSLALQQHNKIKQAKGDEINIKKRMERIDALTSALNNQRQTKRRFYCHLNELQIEMKNAHQYLGEDELQVSVRERVQAKNVPQIFSRISPYPNTMVSRFPVSDCHVPWSCTWTSYDPIAYTQHKELYPRALQPHLDVDIQRLREMGGEEFRMPNFNWNKISVSPGGITTDRQSWITDKSNRAFQYELDSEDLPKNPVGRTGLRGRGILPRWGPNHYIYVVITQMNEKETLNKYMDVVLMNTVDALCLPGGYVHTENRYEIIQSLFHCEGVWTEPEDMATFFRSLACSKSQRRLSLKQKNKQQTSKQKYTDDFQSEKVKLGYMDEDTNTDQAWCEAEVWNFHYSFPCAVKDKFKVDMQWHILSEEVLMQVPIGQAAILHSVAKEMKAILKVI